MTVLVTGAAGTLGRLVVEKLVAAGRPVRALSRRPQPPADGVQWVTGDLTGGDLTAAVDGVDAIIHAATDPRAPRDDVRGTENLLAAASAVEGPPHLVFISIVGIDRVPLPYYRAKLEVEALVAGYPRYTILRTTQFHDFVAAFAERFSRLPIVPVPSGTAVQPIDAGEVAARLIELALGVPLGMAPDLGGPQVRSTAELLRGYLRAHGKRRPVVPVPLPGRIGRGFRRGGHLTPEHADGKRTWEEYLAGSGG